MDGYYKALSDFSSIHWWVSVVLVGILINLSSSGIQAFIGRFWASFKSKTIAKSEREKRDFEHRVRVYVLNPVLMAMDAPLAIGFLLFGLASIIASFFWFFGHATYLLNDDPGAGILAKIELWHSIAWLSFTLALSALSIACVNIGMKTARPLAAARRQIELTMFRKNSPVEAQQVITSKV